MSTHFNDASSVSNRRMEAQARLEADNKLMVKIEKIRKGAGKNCPAGNKQSAEQ